MTSDEFYQQPFESRSEDPRLEESAAESMPSSQVQVSLDTFGLIANCVSQFQRAQLQYLRDRLSVWGVRK